MHTDETLSSIIFFYIYLEQLENLSLILMMTVKVNNMQDFHLKKMSNMGHFDIRLVFLSFEVLC